MVSRRPEEARTCRDDGAAMVEFALVLTVLLVIVFGIINFGYAFGQKLSLNQAVREGARLAVVPNTNGGANGSMVNSRGEIRDLVRASTGGLVTASQVNVTITPGGLAAASGADTADAGCQLLDVGQSLTVKATYQGTFLTPWLLPGLPNGFGLTSEAVYRCEWSG